MDCERSQVSTPPQRHPDPAAVGYLYNMTREGGPVRNQWHTPNTVKQHLPGFETSSSGCTKRRYVYIGHRQRCGLWVWVCMRCETVVGVHIMPHGEGTRDAIIPLYKFVTKPPKAVFFDWACKAHESALYIGFRNTSPTVVSFMIAFMGSHTSVQVAMTADASVTWLP